MNMRHFDWSRTAWIASIATAQLVAWSSASAQTISGIAGQPSNGSSVVVSGVSFGSKPASAPLKWEDFEDGTSGAALSTADGWAAVDGWDGASHSHPPYYNPQVKHAGALGMTCAFVNNTYNSSVLFRGNIASGLYMDTWYQLNPATPASRNYKIFDVFGTGANEYPVVAMTSSCNGSFWVPYYNGGSGDAEWGVASNSNFAGQMHHLQVWLKPSTPGVRDGVLWLAIDGNVRVHRTDMLTVMPNVGTWKEIRIGYYMSHEALNECAASGDGYAFFDDLYIDNSQARVELGNASTYSACTHREIQVPTDWTTSAVTVAFNQGTFASGSDAFLFVVNANGVASPGFPVVIGSSGALGPGQPGKPAF